MPSVALLAILEGLKALPYIVAGIQAIHGESVAGVDKKQLAIDALGLATATADATLPPEQKVMADAAAAAAGTMIDAFVNLFKLHDVFGFHKSAPKAVLPAA